MADRSDEKVIAVYARGMTTREIQGHLKEPYQVEGAPSLISTVTDAVLEGVKAWQARPLEADPVPAALTPCSAWPPRSR